MSTTKSQPKSTPKSVSKQSPKIEPKISNKNHFPFYFKIIVAVVLIGIVGAFAMSNKYQRKSPDVLRDTIKYDKVLSSEKPEEFMGAIAADNESMAPNETHVTVYNQNLALVKEARNLKLSEGYNQVKYQDVPKLINPSSVIFSDMTNEQTEVLEQTYEFDLVSRDKLLEKYLDQEVKVFSNTEQGVKEYSGKLLSYLDGLMLETNDGVVNVQNIQSIQFSKLPEGLITKPTLVWSLYAPKGGEHTTQTTYLTGGLNWYADYVAKVNVDDNKIDIKGWTTIDNKSGTSYPNATLKLIAGDVNIVQPSYDRGYDQVYEMAPVAVSQKTGGGFVEESFFEYHLYSLDRKTNIKDNQQKQISLLNAKNVSVKKVFVYDSNKSWDKVRTMLETENSEEKGLGMPLPKGVIRVYKEDSSGALQFIGEDSIDHTPKDEDVEVFLGNAFDIAVEKKTMESKRSGGLLDFGGRCQFQDIEVTFRNHKESDIEVKVIEHIYGADVEILDSNYKEEKEDEYTYNFIVPVKADDENTLKYTVKTCW